MVAVLILIIWVITILLVQVIWNYIPYFGVYKNYMVSGGSLYGERSESYNVHQRPYNFYIRQNMGYNFFIKQDQVRLLARCVKGHPRSTSFDNNKNVLFNQLREICSLYHLHWNRIIINILYDKDLNYLHYQCK